MAAPLTPPIFGRATARAVTVLLVLCACASDDTDSIPFGPAPTTGPGPAGPPHVLLVILDDVGVWDVAAYGASDPARTPTLDQLAANGTVFERCWSMPVCSPSRATLMTGEYPFRHGIGSARLETMGLSPDATTYLPAHLPETYAKAMIGKWHLTARVGGDPGDPLRCGFDHHAGIMANPQVNVGESYWRWPKVADGVELGLQESYITTDQIDDAIAWIGARSSPWFCVLSLTAAHAPFEPPPPSLAATSESSTARQLFQATVEAADRELARLLDSIDAAILADTVVIVVGDNGSFKLVAPPELAKNRAKGTVYEVGVRVPLIFCGRGIPQRRRISELVGLVDLWATLIELCGGESPGPGFGRDSRSVLPLLRGEGPGPTALKAHQYTEYFEPVGAVSAGERTMWRRAVSDGRWKLVDNPTNVELFDLWSDPLEDNDRIDDPELGSIRSALEGALEGLGGPRHSITGPVAGGGR